MPHCYNDHEEIARILQEDTNSNSARDLQSDENSNYARHLHLRELQEQANSNSARDLQQRYTQEQIDSNYNMAKRLQEKYYRELDKDIPVIQKKKMLKKKMLEKKKVVSPEISFVKLFNELLPFLLFILLIIYLSTFMFSSTKTKGSKLRKK